MEKRNFMVDTTALKMQLSQGTHICPSPLSAYPPTLLPTYSQKKRLNNVYLISICLMHEKFFKNY